MPSALSVPQAASRPDRLHFEEQKEARSNECSMQSVPLVLGLSQYWSVQRTENTSLAMVQNAFALLMGQSGTSQASFLASHDSWGVFHNIGCIIFLSWYSCQSCLMEKTHLKNLFFPHLGQSLGTSSNIMLGWYRGMNFFPLQLFSERHLFFVQNT